MADTSSLNGGATNPGAARFAAVVVRLRWLEA